MAAETITEEQLNEAQRVYLAVFTTRLKRLVDEGENIFLAVADADETAYQTVSLCEHERAEVQTFAKESLRAGALKAKES